MGRRYFSAAYSNTSSLEAKRQQSAGYTTPEAAKVHQVIMFPRRGREPGPVFSKSHISYADFQTPYREAHPDGTIVQRIRIDPNQTREEKIQFMRRVYETITQTASSTHTHSRLSPAQQLRGELQLSERDGSPVLTNGPLEIVAHRLGFVSVKLAHLNAHTLEQGRYAYLLSTIAKAFDENAL